MSDDGLPVLPPDDRLVYCRRQKENVPASSHAECPHCFGTVEEVVTGAPGEFCDWRAGVDPVQPGVPAGNELDCEE